MRKRHSIATRIFALFALTGIIAGSIVFSNFISFTKIASSVEQTVEEQLPTLVSATKIAHIGGIITTDVSNLAGAKTLAALTRARANLESSLPVLSELANMGLTASRGNELKTLVSLLEQNVANISANSQEKLRLKEKQVQVSQQLYWLQVDFVDEVAPLTEESQYNLEQLVSRFDYSQGAFESELRQLTTETNIQAQLLKFEADVNLVLDLLQRVVLFDSRNDVLAAQSMIDDNIHSIASQLKVLKHIPSTITLRQMAMSLAEHLNGPDNTLERSLRIIILDEQNIELLKENRFLIQRIKLIIDQVIVDAEMANQQTTQQLTASLQDSQTQLNYALLVIFALMFTMAWYLKTQILNRLAYVLRSMRHLAQGEPQQMIHVAGKDEVASLADATNVFNYQAQELRRYTETLEQTNHRLVVEVEQRKQAEFDLRETQAGLIQAGKLAVLGQLTTGIVHEFSQPLAAIRSNTYLTKEYLLAHQFEKGVEKLDKIDAITDRATKLCQHLKSFARQTDDLCQPVGLRLVVERALELFTDTAPSEWVRIEIEPKLQVQANEVRLEQVFVNLISNSLDAIERHPSQNRPDIVISARLIGRQVRVSVSDNGCGMTETQVSRVFEPFFTTKEVGKGLGLGMSITHNIIHDFGGSIEVSSSVNIGTEVTVCLTAT